MPELYFELYLRGAIQRDPGRLYDESIRFLQIGCDIPFEPPTRYKPLSRIENPQLIIGAEENSWLALEVVARKYDWDIVGLETVENLPDDQRNNVVVVRHLGFQKCQYRLGIWEGVPERSLLAKGRDRVETLEDLKPGTKIATKHDNYLNRIIRERGLNLEAVHDWTPETAPEFNNRIYIVADNYVTGTTWREQPHPISARENFLDSEAVLIKARRLPRGRGRIFNDMLLPRVEQALEHPERWLNPQPEQER